MEKLLNYFEPVEYQLEECIFRDTEVIKGVVEISGHLVSDAIKLHAKDQKIHSIAYRLSHQSEAPGNNENLFDYEPCDFEYDNEIITIPFTEDMNNRISPKSLNEHINKENSLVEIKVVFETKLNRNMQGCYISTYEFNGEIQKLIATQFESHYAREAFPCVDEPAAKAIFNLRLTIPDYKPDDVVLANTELSEQREKSFYFNPTPRMSTYLLAWVVGPLKGISTVNNHGTKVTSYCALNQNTSSLEFANAVAARALEYYDDKFGIKYPLAKLDQVALPDFEAGAMENWGLVTYRESCMLAEPDASIDTKQSVAVTVTHELSHQWFGNLVTMAWWDDLWLNESFATIMEYYATDALYPELKAWQDFFTGDCIAALRRDCLRDVQSVQQDVNDPEEISTLFDGAIVYAKGARLMLMLIRLMGEDKFHQGVHDYFQKYAYQNTVGDNLWDSLQKYADFDVKSLMHAWISQPGYPALRELYKGDQTEWAEQRFLIDGTTDDSQWPLPEVKDDMSGHYLLDLSDAEFSQKLSRFNELSMEQKLRLLIDRMLLAKTGAASPTSLVELLPKFTQEDAVTWEILLDIICDLKIFFPAESEEEDIYRQFLRNVIKSLIHEVGTSTQENDTNDQKRLRKVLMVIARYARDEKPVQELAGQYNSDLSKINAELRGDILMAKMMLAEAELFEPLLQKYQTENDPEIKDDILCTLGTVRNPENIKTMLSLLEKPEIVRPQDHFYLCMYLLRNYAARTKVIDWIYSHWDYIIEMNGDKNVDYYPRGIANAVNTREEAQEFYRFADQHSDNPALKRVLAMAKDTIEAKLSLIERESSAVQQKVKEMINQ